MVGAVSTDFNNAEDELPFLIFNEVIYGDIHGISSYEDKQLENYDKIQ